MYRKSTAAICRRNKSQSWGGKESLQGGEGQGGGGAISLGERREEGGPKSCEEYSVSVERAEDTMLLLLIPDIVSI